jgi:hypothetical protein
MDRLFQSSADAARATGTARSEERSVEVNIVANLCLAKGERINRKKRF